MKVKKILLSAVLLIISMFLVFKTDVYAVERKTLTVGYSSGNKNYAWTRLGTRVYMDDDLVIHDDAVQKYAYFMNDLNGQFNGTTMSSGKLPVLKIYERVNSSSTNQSTAVSDAYAIYCLRAGQGFGSYTLDGNGNVSDSKTLVDVLYQKSYIMREANAKTTLESITGKTISTNNYNSLMWLLDNLYLPKQESDSENKYNIERVTFFEKLFDQTVQDDVEFTYLNFLTDDDIEVVQQWAIWYFTNNEDTIFGEGLPNIWVSTTGDYSTNKTALSDTGENLGLVNTSYDGSQRQIDAAKLYSALITEAKKHTNYLQENIYDTTLTFSDNYEITSINMNEYYKIGPFQIIKNGDGEAFIDATIVSVENGTEKNIVSYVYDADGEILPRTYDPDNIGQTVYEYMVNNGNFYIVTSKNNLSATKSIKIKYNYSILKTNGEITTTTLWTPINSSGNILTGEQPVVFVERTPRTVTYEYPVTITMPAFDLALRKYITGVKRNDSAMSIDELNGRIPEINKAPLSSTSETTAEYKHRKDPVPVQTDDIVTYKITIYNEGEIDGRATKIVDYLPTGLEFYRMISTNFNYSVSGNVITFTPKTSTNLSAYNKTTSALSSVDIEFECKVTKQAQRGSYDILTNIAEITEAYDVNNNKRYLEGDDRDSIPGNLRRPTDANLPSYIGNTSNSNLTESDRNSYFKGQEDDDDFEKLKVTTPEFDLSLRKFITSVDGTAITDRIPTVDVTPLTNNNVNDTTANYYHKKEPITVGIGSKITYTIRVYNEAETDGYVTIIEDYLPVGLQMVPLADSTVNAKYGWEASADGRTLTTRYWNKTVAEVRSTDTNYIIKGYNKDTMTTLDYKEVKVECFVTTGVEDGKILTNIAQINGESRTDDRDSSPMLPDNKGFDLETYKGKNNIDDLTRTDYYYKGQEDDDDFEKVKVYKPGFDLSLRKFITQIDGHDVTVSRVPDVDTSLLASKQAETAKYKHTKTPLVVNAEGTVRYTIRVYNEGATAGYATKIEDYLPPELEYIDNDFNRNQGWNVVTNKTYGAERTGTIVETEILKNELIAAYTGGNSLSYKDVQIECKVKATAPDGKILTNIAQITAAEDVNHNQIINVGDDRDSEPNNLVPPTDTNLPNYKETQAEASTTNSYIEGEQDDDDFEKVKVYKPKYDLALRKFITAIDGKTSAQRSDLVGRAPVVDVSPLINKTATTATYTHSKNPLSVNIGEKVVYTIRVYNEGEYDGYASLIEDYLPPELELVPADESTVNTKYGWTVIATEQGKSGTTVVTDYWSEAKASVRSEETNYVISAFDSKTMTSLDYRDVQIECLVKTTAPDGKILTNIAQIKDQNRDDDRDSTPDNVVKPSDENLPSYNENQEDDDDFEKVVVYKPKFDLALRKFITHIAGNEVEVSREPVVDVTPLKDKTGNSGTTAIYTHSKEPLEANTGDIVRYTIRVYNEAEVDGYVTEIEDYLPPELVLVSEDESEINRKYGWTVVPTDAGFGGTTVVTDYWSKDKAEARSEDTDYIISAFDTNTNYLHYRDVQIECRIVSSAVDGKILTNIAQINGDSDDDRDSTPDNVVKPSDENLPSYNENQEDDDDYEKIKVHKPEFDLALRKFITHIAGNEVQISREPVVDVTPLINKTATTATYTHPKTALIVNLGDTIKYTIRVYNEAEVDGYATIIEDYLPQELEIVPLEDSTTNSKYNWVVSADGRVVTTNYWNDENSEARGEDNKIKAFDPNTMTTLDYKDVEIECRVKNNATPGKVLTNIAQINGDSGDDRDSEPSNVVKPSDENLPSYKDNQQDDDDYEKLKIYIPVYDLALRKFITKVEDKDITSRVPVVDVTPLTDNDPETTTAIYTHPKTPLLVKNGNVVVYTIRVYNEGEYDAYAEIIKDNIPEGLEFIIDNDINIEYRWRLSADQKTVTSDYLSSARSENNVIKAFNPNTMATLDYKDVKIAFKVIEPNTSTRIIKNIAEIKQDDIDDIDSTPDNDIPTEDDIDEENIRVKYFDLALQKFITKVENKNGEQLPIEAEDGEGGTTIDKSREPYPVVLEDGRIEYVNTKNPVIVANSDIVTYTIRVYNEGTVEGFAEEIKDDVPVGLEMLPDHPTNIAYGWKMYDEDGNETTDPTLAKTIRTTYLSEQNSPNNVLNAFDRATMTEPDHKDVQVAFKVTEKNIATDRIIINTAEISKDSDDDIDSTPDNDKPNEDDIDQEYIRVKYFDLSLLKWVSKVMLTENGNTKITETGYNGLEDPEPIVKLELKNSQINKVTLKYEYGIKITNEGEIPGYATEITDYIPEGLEFIKEDNPLWEVRDDGRIYTNQLAGTLLKPGESTVINVVFKWKNSENNMGIKVNWAEISKDDNDKDAEDIDSTPDNNERNPKEDDIDEAYIVLNPKTGVNPAFVILPTIVIAILATGIVLIKKYVL